MKRVLLVAYSNMSLSGVPVVYMSIVRHLCDEYKFDIIIFDRSDMHFEKEFLSYGGKIFYYDRKEYSNEFLKVFWLFFKYKKNYKSFLDDNNIRLSDYDVIHSFDEFYSFPLFCFAKKQGINNLFLHINSAESAYEQKRSLKRLFVNAYQNKSKKLCKQIIFVSNKAMQIHNYKNKGVVIYNEVDNRKYNKIIECIHDNLVLSQIGTISTRKNQLFSLKVISSIKKTYPNIKLNIVGNVVDQDYYLKLKAYINSQNLNDNICFLESSYDQKALYSDTSYILFPSIQESFGIVLIEAQSSGVHCFSSNLIPLEADLGNVDFIELDHEAWARFIINYFGENKNLRSEPINIEKFSGTSFRANLIAIYNS